jgi:threonine/homoserine/homoserine lactone efflux protein
LFFYGVISFIKTSKSFRSIVKEYQKVKIQKNYIQLFIKGFFLNFINIGVLLGWLGFIVVANSITSSQQGVIVFITSMIITYFITDIFKIIVAKQIKNKLTPKRIYKTKKLVALAILVFGIILVVQGLFPESKTLIQQNIKEVF